MIDMIRIFWFVHFLPKIFLSEGYDSRLASNNEKLLGNVRKKLIAIKMIKKGLVKS